MITTHVATQTSLPTQSSSHRVYRITAFFLFLEFLLILIPTFALMAVFQFPDILDLHGNYVMPLFEAKRGIVLPLYYVFMLSGLVLIPLALLLEHVLSPKQDAFMRIATAFGIMTGITQTLGFIRWAFLVPYLADAYTAPHASETTRQTLSIVYDAFNFYAGHAIGEHLGFLLNIIWAIMIGIAMVRSPLFKGWIGWLGIVTAFGVIAEILQLFITSPTVQPVLQQIFVISYTLWVLWLIVPAIPLLRINAAVEHR